MIRLLFIILLLPSFVFGATITGTVYDLELDEIETAIVTINTEPSQRIVAKDGTYSFNVPPGNYELVAEATIRNEKWVADESITVSKNGTYILDLILIPDFNLDAISLDDEELPVIIEDEPTKSYWQVFLPIILVALAGIYYLFFRSRPNISEDDEFKRNVIEIIQKNKGRITQKNLRKELPFSEAKVSLVLAELESEGKIQKIKKGRGNIIVWKR